MSEVTLIENLTKLAQTRNKVDELSDLLSVTKDELANLPLYQSICALEDEIKEVKKNEKELSDEVRTDAWDLASAYNFENRKPVAGIELKQFTVVNITDENEAKKWAALNSPSLLTLSKKFDSVVKNLEVSFIKVDTEYRVQIASNLDEYLEQ